MTNISVSDAKEVLAVIAGYRDDEARWPRYRQGKREPIPWQIRVAVYERDGARCLSCGRALAYKEAQLDHIQPWSAYGTDRSDNLRILCESCNMDRSNFRGSLDTWNAKRQPVAFRCVHCADDCGNEECERCQEADFGDEGSHLVAPWMILAYCVPCGIVAPAWETY